MIKHPPSWKPVTQQDLSGGDFPTFKDGHKTVGAIFDDNNDLIVEDETGIDLNAAKLMASAPELLSALKPALEYWKHRQQRYKNRHPVWAQEANAALEKLK